MTTFSTSTSSRKKRHVRRRDNPVRGRPKRSVKRRARATPATVSGTAGPDAAAAADRSRRLRDRDRGAPRRLGSGLLERQGAQHLQRLHGRDRRRRLSSAKIGTDLGELLTTPGLKQAELETRLSGLIQREQQNVEGAQGFDVPGPLRPAHEHAVEALQFRVSGMQGLLGTFKATKSADTKNATAAGEQLSTQARRLETSDIVWLDLFRKPAQATVRDKNLTGVSVPASIFVENVELYTTRSMTSIWQRIHGASTGGTAAGVHGTGLDRPRCCRQAQSSRRGRRRRSRFPLRSRSRSASRTPARTRRFGCR